MSSGELDAKRKQLRLSAQKILAQDHFGVLGVTRTSSTEEVKKAFVEAAKAWHPDRLPGGLEDLQSLFAEVFGRLDAARSTLVDPGRRMDYVRVIAGEKAAAATAGAAALELAKAESFMKKNDLKAAEAHIRRAIVIAPENPDYASYLVNLEASKPNVDKARLRTLVTELDGLLANSATCERAYFVRGQLRKRLDLAKEAAADFAEAARLNPRNVDAAREVRLHTMRAAKAEGASETGKRPAVGGRDSSPNLAGEGAEPAGIGSFFKKLFNR